MRAAILKSGLLQAQCIAMLLVLPVAQAKPTASNGPPQQLVATWHGRSLCVTQRPACTDESVRYRITSTRPDAMALRIDADKQVDDGFAFMGSLDCQFQVTRQLLVCASEQDRWTFRWDGDDLIGVLITEDGEPFRVIRVRRERAAR